MKALQLTDEKARKLYTSAQPELKEILIDSFGKDFFSQKITDRVKSFEDACLVLHVRDGYEVYVGDTNALTDDMKSIHAYTKLIIIARALNEGWVPDWENKGQYKYYPWFKMNPSGSGLAYCVYGLWHSFTGVGSRLCFKSSELAEYAGKQFENIYNDFLSL